MPQESSGENILNSEYTSLIGYLFDSITHLKSAKITFVRSEPGLGCKLSLPISDQSFMGFLIGSIDKFRSGNCDVLPTIGSSDFDFRRVMVTCI